MSPQPAALQAACERIAGWMHTTAGAPDVVAHVAGEWLLRSDLAAVLAHAGWSVSIEDARLDEPVTVVEPSLFGDEP